MNYVTRVVHSRSNGFFVRPFARGMRAEPRRGRSVAIFAAHAFGNFKRAPALFWRGIERVARQTLRRLLRFRAKFQDARHAFADIAGERLVGAAVLVLQNPGGVFGLQDAAVRDRLHAAVATGGGAGARPDVFLRVRCLDFAWFAQKPKTASARE